MAKEGQHAISYYYRNVQKACEGGYAAGAFNVNNMEIVQGIVDAAKEEQSPLYLAEYSEAHVNMLNIFTFVKTCEAAL